MNYIYYKFTTTPASYTSTTFLRATASTASLITPLTHSSHFTNTTHAHANTSASSHRGAHSPTYLHTHTRIRSSSHCSSLFPRLSSLVQVGRLESGGRLNLSTLLTIIVWQQTYRVKHNFTSSQMPQQGLIDPAWHHRGQWNGEGELQSSADLAPDWGQIAIRNGFSWSDGLMDVQGFGECKNYEHLIAL